LTMTALSGSLVLPRQWGSCTLRLTFGYIFRG